MEGHADNQVYLDAAERLAEVMESQRGIVDDLCSRRSNLL